MRSSSKGRTDSDSEGGAPPSSSSAAAQMPSRSLRLPLSFFLRHAFNLLRLASARPSVLCSFSLLCSALLLFISSLDLVMSTPSFDQSRARSQQTTHSLDDASTARAAEAAVEGAAAAAAAAFHLQADLCLRRVADRCRSPRRSRSHRWAAAESRDQLASLPR